MTRGIAFGFLFAICISFLCAFVQLAHAGSLGSTAVAELPGTDPDADARFRGRYQPGHSYWKPQYLESMRRLRSRWWRIAPVYFYGRTCGPNQPRRRQIIMRIGHFDIDTLLADEKSQLSFLMYLRWQVEAYWRRIVPEYRLEPPPVFVVDFEGLGWRKAISNMFKINSLIRQVNAAFNSITGFGGRSRLPLGSGPADSALHAFSAAAADDAADEDAFRLPREAEDFPPIDAIQKIAAAAAGTATTTVPPVARTSPNTGEEGIERQVTVTVEEIDYEDNTPPSPPIKAPIKGEAAADSEDDRSTAAGSDTESDK
ncbi:hypothetical protein, conserved [Eimeria maxima]|uniref:CRAL-TRIO domain-containing protein n=1 Tax=Eimeria maxima TaxID=5804 RepID=U6LZC1_EIMMA|nr:hypothetical protein, conserved [Eimeria maxima]CDJ57322.1 hypothetical protein, conserved [Eimeria maxima]